MRATTYALSIILLAVVLADFFGVKLKSHTETTEQFIYSVSSVNDFVYIITIDGVWCRENGYISMVNGTEGIYVTSTYVTSNHLYIASSVGAYEITGCISRKIDLPERW